MPNYRRAFRPGGTFFFTQVTYRRMRFLCDGRARLLFREAIESCRSQMPFEIDAFVLMPDHLHAIWTLPDGDADFSKRWGIIKKTFTQRWIESGGVEATVSESRLNNRRRGVWQRHFWEHMIRDERDLENHLNYIHYNPVKHGHATCPHLWPWSSFHRMVNESMYTADWCCGCRGGVVKPPNCGDMDEAE